MSNNFVTFHAVQTLSLAEVGVEAELICSMFHYITRAHPQKLHGSALCLYYEASRQTIRFVIALATNIKTQYNVNFFITNIYQYVYLLSIFASNLKRYSL